MGDRTAIEGQAIRVRAYFGERDRHHGKPLWGALLEFLRREHAAGATVTRGIADYGANSTIHAASIVDLSADLPLVLEWVDTDEVVNRLLPAIEGMLQGGLIATDPVTIIRYQAHAEGDRESLLWTLGGGPERCEACGTLSAPTAGGRGGPAPGPAGRATERGATMTMISRDRG